MNNKPSRPRPALVAALIILAAVVVILVFAYGHDSRPEADPVKAIEPY